MHTHTHMHVLASARLILPLARQTKYNYAASECTTPLRDDTGKAHAIKKRLVRTLPRWISGLPIGKVSVVVMQPVIVRRVSPPACEQNKSLESQETVTSTTHGHLRSELCN